MLYKLTLTGLSPSSAGLPRPFRFIYTYNIGVLQPPDRLNGQGLGFSPFARHYSGNHYIVFSSSGYLDVSVLRVCSYR